MSRPRKAEVIPAPETPDRILDAAERLLATLGYEGTSLRAVTREAGVNLAAVGYHFGGKDGLIRAVLSRRVGPINQDRLAQLEALEAGATPPALRDVVRAFVEPTFRQFQALGPTGRLVMGLIGRLHGEPTDHIRRFVKEQFGDTARRFHEALCRALPDLGPEAVGLRMISMIGVMTFHLSMGESCPVPTAERATLEQQVDEVVAFVAAGFEHGA